MSLPFIQIQWNSLLRAKGVVILDIARASYNVQFDGLYMPRSTERKIFKEIHEILHEILQIL